MNKIHVRPAWSELFVITNFCAELLHHRFVSVGHKEDGVRHTSVERMRRQWPAGEGDLLIEAQVLWLSERHGHAFTLEGRANDAGAGLERCFAVGAGQSLNEASETARAVPAHVRLAAITVVELPRPVGFPGFGRDQEKQAVGTDATLAMAQPHNLIARELDVLGPIVDEDKVVPGAVHFGKLQNHDAGKLSKRREKTSGSQRGRTRQAE